MAERPDAPWQVGRVRLRKVRGPKPDDPLSFYWRAMVDDVQVWAGWSRRHDSETCRKILESSDAAVPPSQSVRYLLGTWRARMEQRLEPGALKPLRRRSAEVYRACVGHLSRLLGAEHLEEITEATLRGYLRVRLTETGETPKGKRLRPASLRTIRQELLMFRAAWRWGKRQGIVGRDLEVPLPKVDAKPKRTPTQGDVVAVMAEAPTWLRLLLEVLAGTGMRLGELAVLTWDRVDLERGEVMVPGKGGRDRLVPLEPETIEALRKAERLEDGRVIPAAEATVRSAQRILGRICARLKIPRFGPHGVRRLFVDRMYEAGNDVGEVAALAGHSPTVALAHYRQARPERLRAAMSRAKIGRLPRGQVLKMAASQDESQGSES